MPKKLSDENKLPEDDISKQRFGRLTVLKFAFRRIVPRGPKSTRKIILWECLCDCGKIALATKGNLLKNTRSCGCLKSELATQRLTRHGCNMKGRRTKGYASWASMLERCNNQRHRSYKNYGGRGISVCRRWYDFAKFKADMGEPLEGMTLERINNEGNYTRKNCRWASRKEQMANTRRNVLIEYRGERKHQQEWARIYQINHKTLHYRFFKLGWSFEKSVLTPIGRWKRK